MTTNHPASRACYLRGCNQPGCVNANKRFCKEYRVDRYQNGPRRVDATEARATVHTYIAAGWSYSAISSLAGCGDTVIVDLVRGAARINPRSAQCIAGLPTTPPGIRGAAYADATGTIRRGRALVRIGHQVNDIATALHMHPDALSRTLNRDTGLVLATTAHAMTALYELWRWKPGRSQRGRRRAQQLDWHGPLAWDATTINDPAAQPDTEGEGVDAVRKRDSDRPREIEHLAGFQFSAETIASQVGLPVKDVEARLAKIRSSKAKEQVEA